MSDQSTVKFTIAFNDPELDSEDLEAQAQNMLVQRRELDDIEAVERVVDPNPPAGSKAMGAIIVGLLTAQVNKENAQRAMSFLGERLINKPIELEVEANDRKLKVKASNRAELQAAIEAAQKFVAEQE